MIEVRDLRKSYGSLRAVDGVSFDLHPGETFGLLGPNGAGKTTTIHLMVGVLKPDAGSVRINGGADPTRPDVRRQIGIAPQAQALYADLTGEENLAFFARLYGLAGARLAERVAWALEFSGLADRRKHAVRTYSGGMQRRLNLAVALVHDPPVLFLDEPTVGVDPQSRNHIFDSIEALKKQGRTILYTTHYMEEAQRLCDRVAIMDRGKILALDTVSGLLDAHGGRSVIRADLESVPADTAALPGRLEGNTLVIETPKPLEEVARLAQLGLKLSALHVTRPNLETVFLELTGRSLRDA
jgi:ABC-2 type transport system ATP-binding protein